MAPDALGAGRRGQLARPWRGSADLYNAARKAHALIRMLTDGVLEDAGTDEDEALEVYDALEHALQLMDKAIHPNNDPSNPPVPRSPTANDV